MFSELVTTNELDVSPGIATQERPVAESHANHSYALSPAWTAGNADQTSPCAEIVSSTIGAFVLSVGEVVITGVDVIWSVESELI